MGSTLQAAGGTIQYVYGICSNSVYGLAFSHDNKILAAGFAEGKIRIYELDSLKLLYTLKGYNSTVITIIFSKKDDLLVSSAIGKEIIIWDTRTYEPVQIIPGEITYTCQFRIRMNILQMQASRIFGLLKLGENWNSGNGKRLKYRFSFFNQTFII